MSVPSQMKLTSEKSSLTYKVEEAESDSCSKMSGNYEIYQKQCSIETTRIFLHVIKFDKHTLTPRPERLCAGVCVFDIFSKFLTFSVYRQHVLLMRGQRDELTFLLSFHNSR
jgi:hypothetical protein